MKSYSTLVNFATSNSQNISAQNQAYMAQLINDQHRFLIERYFDNERSFATETIGAMNLTLTGLPASGATSATLSSAWTYASGVQTVYFTNSNSDSRQCQFTLNSATITWQEPLTGAVTSTSISTGGFQKYRIPSNISKITNTTVMVGQLRFVPAPIQTRTQWDNVNFLPYPSDIPNYYYIYNGYLELWPVPSTTGNTVTFNYKARVPDFSNAFLFNSTGGAQYVAGQTTYDYQQGTLTSGSADDIAIVGTGTKWVTAQASNGGLGMTAGVDVSQYNLYLSVPPPAGDGIWYPIQSFTDDTHLTLASPLVNSINGSSASYLIGQMPVLQEDFHDMLVYGALKTYFSTYSPDPNKFKQFDALYKERELLLADYAGTKQVNYDLGAQPALLNPNNYPFYPNGVNA